MKRKDIEKILRFTEQTEPNSTLAVRVADLRELAALALVAVLASESAADGR